MFACFCATQFTNYEDYLHHFSTGSHVDYLNKDMYGSCIICTGTHFKTDFKSCPQCKNRICSTCYAIVFKCPFCRTHFRVQQPRLETFFELDAFIDDAPSQLTGFSLVLDELIRLQRQTRPILRMVAEYAADVDMILDTGNQLRHAAMRAYNQGMLTHLASLLRIYTLDEDIDEFIRQVEMSPENTDYTYYSGTLYVALSRAEFTQLSLDLRLFLPANSLFLNTRTQDDLLDIILDIDDFLPDQ